MSVNYVIAGVNRALGACRDNISGTCMSSFISLLPLKSWKLGPTPRNFEMSVTGLGNIQATDDLWSSLYKKVLKRNKHTNALICCGTPLNFIKKFKSRALSVLLRGCCHLKAATFDEILGTYREQSLSIRFWNVECQK